MIQLICKECRLIKKGVLERLKGPQGKNGPCHVYDRRGLWSAQAWRDGVGGRVSNVYGLWYMGIR